MLRRLLHIFRESGIYELDTEDKQVVGKKQTQRYTEVAIDLTPSMTDP